MTFLVALTTFFISATSWANLAMPHLSPIDCLTHRLRALISSQGPEALTNFERKLAKTMNGRSPELVETELLSILEDFSNTHPTFPKDEFKAWMKNKPLTATDVERATELRAHQGNILDYRFQVFKLESETRAAAKQMGEEIVDTVKSCKGNPGCANAKVNGFFRRKFSCTFGDKKVQSVLLATYLVQNATYFITSKTTDHDYAWDLAFTNALLNPVITELYCRRAQGPISDVQPSVKDQYKNLFLGQKNEFGARPGFLRTGLKLQVDLVKLGALWAGTYKVANTMTETTLYGKGITFSPLTAESAEKMVSLNPVSIVKESGSIMLFYDLPFASQRNIFMDTHLYTIALPSVIKNTALLFTAQTAIKVGVGVFSTHVFQCWDDAGRSYNETFWNCFHKRQKENPELRGIAIPAIPESEHRAAAQ